MKYDVVIVASGKGERAKLGYNKAFFKMKNGKTVLENAASLFIEDNDCQKIIIVTSKDCFEAVFKNNKTIVVEGGKERRNSVENGLKEVNSEYVLIHDGARPFLQKEALEDVKKEVEKSKATVLVKKAVETLKVVHDSKITGSIDRTNVYMAETPQAFETTLIKKCFKESDNPNFTDDASLVELSGHVVTVVEDKFDNKKLTLDTDFTSI